MNMNKTVVLVNSGMRRIIFKGGKFFKQFRMDDGWMTDKSCLQYEDIADDIDQLEDDIKFYLEKRGSWVGA